MVSCTIPWQLRRIFIQPAQSARANHSPNSSSKQFQWIRFCLKSRVKYLPILGNKQQKPTMQRVVPIKLYSRLANLGTLITKIDKMLRKNLSENEPLRIAIKYIRRIAETLPRTPSSDGHLAMSTHRVNEIWFFLCSTLDRNGVHSPAANHLWTIFGMRLCLYKPKSAMYYIVHIEYPARKFFPFFTMEFIWILFA